MRLWIDNTGLHSVGQCLVRAATGDHDVKGLLQFATLLVYGDSLGVNGYEPMGIASRSKYIVDHLVGLGCPGSAVVIKPVSRDLYALACKSAAAEAEENLLLSFNPQQEALLGCEPTNLPLGDYERQIHFPQLLRLKDDSAQLADTLVTALDEQSVGAVDYIIASSGLLRCRIRELIEHFSSWTDLNSYQLNAYLRCELNQALADRYGAEYTPAVPRAQLVNRQCHHVLNSLDDVADSVVSELRGSSIGVPSVIAFLVSRCKGDPLGVIEEALRLRQQTEALRALLQQYIDAFGEDSPEGRFHIRAVLRGLGEDVRGSLGLCKSHRLVDAIDLSFIIGIPVPRISAVKLLEWLRFRVRRRRVTVLTDLVKKVAYYDDFHRDYRRLSRGCGCASL